MEKIKTAFVLVVFSALWLFSGDLQDKDLAAKAAAKIEQEAVDSTTQVSRELTRNEKLLIVELLSFTEKRLQRKYPRQYFLMMNDYRDSAKDFYQMREDLTD